MTAAGDLEQATHPDNGSAGAIALHTAVGGTAAALGGSNALGGAIGAGTSEAAISYLQQYGTTAVLLGTTVIGDLVGGGAGASAALAGTEYNYLSQLANLPHENGRRLPVIVQQGVGQAPQLRFHVSGAGLGGGQLLPRRFLRNGRVHQGPP